MTANSLNRGYSQHRKPYHRNFDYVDVAKNGGTEDCSEDNLNKPKAHQRKDNKSGSEIKA